MFLSDEEEKKKQAKSKLKPKKEQSVSVTMYDKKKSFLGDALDKRKRKRDKKVAIKKSIKDEKRLQKLIEQDKKEKKLITPFKVLTTALALVVILFTIPTVLNVTRKRNFVVPGIDRTFANKEEAIKFIRDPANHESIKGRKETWSIARTDEGVLSSIKEIENQLDIFSKYAEALNERSNVNNVYLATKNAPTINAQGQIDGSSYYKNLSGYQFTDTFTDYYQGIRHDGTNYVTSAYRSELEAILSLAPTTTGTYDYNGVGYATTTEAINAVMTDKNINILTHTSWNFDPAKTYTLSDGSKAILVNSNTLFPSTTDAITAGKAAAKALEENNIKPFAFDIDQHWISGVFDATTPNAKKYTVRRDHYMANTIAEPAHEAEPIYNIIPSNVLTTRPAWMPADAWDKTAVGTHTPGTLHGWFNGSLSKTFYYIRDEYIWGGAGVDPSIALRDMCDQTTGRVKVNHPAWQAWLGFEELFSIKEVLTDSNNNYLGFNENDCLPDNGGFIFDHGPINQWIHSGFGFDNNNPFTGTTQKTNIYDRVAFTKRYFKDRYATEQEYKDSPQITIDYNQWLNDPVQANSVSWNNAKYASANDATLTNHINNFINGGVTQALLESSNKYSVQNFEGGSGAPTGNQISSSIRFDESADALAEIRNNILLWEPWVNNIRYTIEASNPFGIPTTHVTYTELLNTVKNNASYKNNHKINTTSKLLTVNPNIKWNEIPEYNKNTSYKQIVNYNFSGNSYFVNGISTGMARYFLTKKSDDPRDPDGIEGVGIIRKETIDFTKTHYYLSADNGQSGGGIDDVKTFSTLRELFVYWEHLINSL